MRKSDIRNLEKVVRKYKEIEDLLEKTEESVYKDNDKFTFEGIEPATVSVSSLISEMESDAKVQRTYIEGKIKCFKEMVK